MILTGDKFNDLKISIITINYNNAAGLEKTICSIVAQTYRFIEYILIDGGSADGSKDVINRYAGNFAYSISEPDTGIYSAMNKGIRAATGDYLLFINSGDILLNDSVIEEAIRFRLDKDLVSGNIVFSEGKDLRDWIVDEEISFRTFYESTIPHPGTFIKRELFEEVGLYNEQYTIVSDWDFFLLATCKFNCSYKHINLSISLFFLDGISANPENFSIMLAERGDVLNRHFPFFIKDYEKYKDLEQDFRKVRKYAKAKKVINRFLKGKYS